MDSFNAECEDVCFDDWLPSFRRAALWYSWSEKDYLLQLAWHLCDRTLQEWELLGKDSKKSLAMQLKLCVLAWTKGSNILSAQDFWYTKQREDETVDSFVRRPRKTYQRAYRRDGLGQKHKTHCCMVISMKV